MDRFPHLLLGRPSMKSFPSVLRLGFVALLLAAFAPGVLAQTLPETVEDGRAPLTSSDVSDQEVTSAAVVLVALEQQRKKAEQKYGDPETMDAQERGRIQQKMMKKRQEIMQQKAVEEGLDPGRMGLIVVSARKDSVLNDRIHDALEAERKNVKNHQSTANEQASEQ